MSNLRERIKYDPTVKTEHNAHSSTGDILHKIVKYPEDIEYCEGFVNPETEENTGSSTSYNPGSSTSYNPIKFPEGIEYCEGFVNPEVDGNPR